MICSSCKVIEGTKFQVTTEPDVPTGMEVIKRVYESDLCPKCRVDCDRAVRKMLEVYGVKLKEIK